jgi:hypothetical protein
VQPTLYGISGFLISQNQTIFLKGMYILESVVAAHEIIHDVAYSDQSGFVFKLDYEKAYDRVDRSFLIKMVQGRGFSSKWMEILMSLLDRGSLGVRLNDENSDFFLTSRAVRQGDPISPIPFNYVADVFTKMLIKAADKFHITGLILPRCLLKLLINFILLV